MPAYIIYDDKKIVNMVAYPIPPAVKEGQSVIVRTNDLSHIRIGDPISKMEAGKPKPNQIWDDGKWSYDIDKIKNQKLNELDKNYKKCKNIRFILSWEYDGSVFITTTLDENNISNLLIATEDDAFDNLFLETKTRIITVSIAIEPIKREFRNYIKAKTDNFFKKYRVAKKRIELIENEDVDELNNFNVNIFDNREMEISLNDAEWQTSFISEEEI